MLQEENKANTLKALVRNRNGMYLLSQALCARGLDFETLLAEPETPTGDGKSYGILLREIDALGQTIFQKLDEIDYDAAFIESLLEAFDSAYQADREPLNILLKYVCTDLLPRLQKVTDELDHFIEGINGQFVPPGQAGAPTRGNAHILPTGRNFYTVDPGAMPSRAAWEIGKILGDQLIERYLRDSGRYPESISMLVWATDAMRTYGDDVAETFYLLGVKPVWLGNTERVVGIEVIPLEELGRPRIDVTLRITGLFRDAFPNLIERVEDAVNLVASLDEAETDNFIRKHVAEDIAELTALGTDLNEAQELALLRVFGDAPGSYGAGVAHVVGSKKWEDVTDLGQVYTTGQSCLWKNGMVINSRKSFSPDEEI